MRVNVGSIKGRKGASLDLDFEERMSAPWDGNVEFIEPVTARVTLLNTGKGYLATGDASARSRIVCDRCLEPFEIDLEAHFEQEFRKEDELEAKRARTWDESADRSSDVEFDDDEPRTFEGDTIDLDETVAEAFLLAAPVKFVCREDCSGICPVCGTNQNIEACGCEIRSIDPRLAGLAELLDDKGQD